MPFFFKTVKCKSQSQYTFPGTNIVDSDFTGFCLLESFDMSINQVSDVNVVPYASSIGGFVVCSFDLSKYTKRKKKIYE